MITRFRSIAAATALLVSSLAVSGCGARQSTTEVTRSTTVESPVMAAPVPAITTTTTTVEQNRR